MDIAKAVIRRKFKNIKVYINEKERAKVDNLTLYLGELEKEEQINLNISRRKKIKNKEEINKTETKKTVEKTNNCFLNKQIDKLSAKIINKKEMDSSKFRNERGGITTDIT